MTIIAGELGMKWLVHSGGKTSESCGVLLSGAAMKFSGSAERLLETSDLDLLHATSVVSSCIIMMRMMNDDDDDDDDDDASLLSWCSRLLMYQVNQKKSPPYDFC